MNKLCIYHGGCDDGFGAAWVVHKAKLDYEFFPGDYAKPPPDVTDRKVLLVDFSYKRPVMEAMCEKARSVTILDHHKTAEDQIRPLLESGMVDGEFDMGRSGAVMTWDWFMEGKRPELLLYIQDRDLWRKQLTRCDQVIMALRSYPQDFAIWDELMAAPIERLMDEGVAIHRYYRGLVEQAKRSVRCMMLGPHWVPCVNVPHYLASEVAGELCGLRERDDSPPAPFAACYWCRSDGRWTFSLRSRDGFNCGAFAEEWFGGGGHVASAGFVVDSLSDLSAIASRRL